MSHLLAPLPMKSRALGFSYPGEGAVNLNPVNGKLDLDSLKLEIGYYPFQEALGTIMDSPANMPHRAPFRCSSLLEVTAKELDKLENELLIPLADAYEEIIPRGL